MTKKISTSEVEDNFTDELKNNFDLVNEHEDVIPHVSIWKSILDFQNEVPALCKNTQGYGYKYVDLAEIINTIRPILAKHGLGFIQPLRDNGVIETIIFHYPSSQQISSQVQMPMGIQLKGMNDFQVYGNAISYFRRYSLSTILGLVTDKDNDSAGEQTPKKTYERTVTPPITIRPKIDNDRLSEALKAIDNGNYTFEKLKDQFTLTDEQIKIAELSFKLKK